MFTVLWDNDGVLVDTEGLHFRATRAVLATVGVELTPELASDYNVLKGGLLPFGMIFLLMSPLIAAKMRRVV